MWKLYKNRPINRVAKSKILDLPRPKTRVKNFVTRISPKLNEITQSCLLVFCRYLQALSTCKISKHFIKYYASGSQFKIAHTRGCQLYSATYQPPNTLGSPSSGNHLENNSAHSMPNFIALSLPVPKIQNYFHEKANSPHCATI